MPGSIIPLPQHGFDARFGAGEAAIEQREGAVGEWSRTPEALYVNARRAGKPIAFPGASTDGSFRVAQGGERLPLP